MKVWAISDLHLSFGGPDRRDDLSLKRREQTLRVEREWRAVVAPDDLVLLPGDISMARNHRDVQPDLAWIDRLPGRKVFSPGNHDAWFGKVLSIRRFLRRSQFAVNGDSLRFGDVVVCGSRSYPADDETEPLRKKEDSLLFDLRLALLRANTYRDFIRHRANTLGIPVNVQLYVLWHHPPFNRYGIPSRAAETLAEHEVDVCVYGHLHAISQWGRSPQGLHDNVRYYCVAADAVGFRPLRVDNSIEPTMLPF